MCKGFNSSIFNFILAKPFDARTEERGLLFFFTQSLEVIKVPAGTDSDLQAFSQNSAKENFASLPFRQLRMPTTGISDLLCSGGVSRATFLLLVN